MKPPRRKNISFKSIQKIQKLRAMLSSSKIKYEFIPTMTAPLQGWFNWHSFLKPTFRDLTKGYLIRAIILSLFCPNIVYASWYNQKLEGWYYFQEPKLNQENQEKPLSMEEADSYLAIESRQLKQLLSLAIVSPTPENVESYMRAQRRLMERSGKFAQMWGKVLLEHPELSDLLSTPTSSYGILAKREIDMEKRKKRLQDLSKDHFLLFFFRGTELHSQKSAEVAQLFSSTNNWKMKAISMDSLGTPELSNFESDKGISQHLNVTTTPSFFIVNSTEGQAYPVGIGMISVSELEENIENQTKGVSDDL